jgi:hypothetical protein
MISGGSSASSSGSKSLLQKMPYSFANRKEASPLLEQSTAGMSPQERRRRRAAAAAAQKRRRRRKVIKIGLAIVILLGAIAAGYHLYSSSTREMQGQDRAAMIIQDMTTAASTIGMENNIQHGITTQNDEGTQYVNDDSHEAELVDNQAPGHEDVFDDEAMEMMETPAGGGGVDLDTPVLLQIIQKLCFGSWMFGKSAAGRHHHVQATIRLDHLEDFLSCMMQ